LLKQIDLSVDVIAFITATAHGYKQEAVRICEVGMMSARVKPFTRKQPMDAI
jgi:hypothetical protein